MNRVNAIQEAQNYNVLVERDNDVLIESIHALLQIPVQDMLKRIGMSDIDIMSCASNNKRWSNEYAAMNIIKYLIEERNEQKRYKGNK